MIKIFYILFVLNIGVFSCSKNNEIPNIEEETIPEENIDPSAPKTFKILSLGDSYTIGQSVCETCRFPNQLKDSLQNHFNDKDTFNLNIIAQTGWTTNNLKNNINSSSPDVDNDLVTLLIGVNNQYQGITFSLYETEFPELVQTAKRLAKGNKNNIIVISIPDYAYTSFGQNSLNPSQISTELDTYNTFTKNYCATNNITFINITDITRMGLQNTNFVAIDGLHPSELAYSKFVERILPAAIDKLKN